ncbi:unnamed protein product [Amoebophrya sp. A25]|nr:unnamed protein product [Amoebophrya sp. A25]|eukprot:GSA25T00024514001.1
MSIEDFVGRCWVLALGLKHLQDVGRIILEQPTIVALQRVREELPDSVARSRGLNLKAIRALSPVLDLHLSQQSSLVLEIANASLYAKCFPKLDALPWRAIRHCSTAPELLRFLETSADLKTDPGFSCKIVEVSKRFPEVFALNSGCLNNVIHLLRKVSAGIIYAERLHKQAADEARKARLSMMRLDISTHLKLYQLYNKMGETQRQTKLQLEAEYYRQHGLPKLEEIDEEARQSSRNVRWNSLLVGTKTRGERCGYDAQQSKVKDIMQVDALALSAAEKDKLETEVAQRREEVRLRRHAYYDRIRTEISRRECASLQRKTTLGMCSSFNIDNLLQDEDVQRFFMTRTRSGMEACAQLRSKQDPSFDLPDRVATIPLPPASSLPKTVDAPIAELVRRAQSKGKSSVLGGLLVHLPLDGLDGYPVAVRLVSFVSIQPYRVFGTRLVPLDPFSSDGVRLIHTNEQPVELAAVSAGDVFFIEPQHVLGEGMTRTSSQSIFHMCLRGADSVAINITQAKTRVQRKATNAVEPRPAARREVAARVAAPVAAENRPQQRAIAQPEPQHEIPDNFEEIRDQVQDGFDSVMLELMPHGTKPFKIHLRGGKWTQRNKGAAADYVRMTVQDVKMAAVLHNLGLFKEGVKSRDFSISIHGGEREAAVAAAHVARAFKFFARNGATTTTLGSEDEATPHTLMAREEWRVDLKTDVDGVVDALKLRGEYVTNRLRKDFFDLVQSIAYARQFVAPTDSDLLAMV